MNGSDNDSAGKCPVMHGGNTTTDSSVMAWWPKALSLDTLHQHLQSAVCACVRARVHCVAVGNMQDG